MTPSCKEVTRLVSQGLDRDLSVAEQVALRAHFALCKGCENFSKQLAMLRSVMRRINTTRDDDREP